VRTAPATPAELSGKANSQSGGRSRSTPTATTVASIAASGTGITAAPATSTRTRWFTLTVGSSAAVDGQHPRRLADADPQRRRHRDLYRGSGSTSLTFSYTVAAGKTRSDLGRVLVSIRNGATVQTVPGNNVNLARHNKQSGRNAADRPRLTVPVFNQETSAVTTSSAAVFAFLTSNTETNGVSYAYKIDGEDNVDAVTGSTLSLSGAGQRSHGFSPGEGWGGERLASPARTIGLSRPPRR